MPSYRAYLTIDDSPSERTDDLTAFLSEQNIPALLFCRGDRLEENPDPIINAIRQGFVIGNHAYSHQRASGLPFEQVVTEIEKTEQLIDQAYRAAKVNRPEKYFRFPHMDRGCGGWVVDYDAAPKHKNTLLTLFTDGLNADTAPPSKEQTEKKERLQVYLKKEGFTTPFSGITHDWYAETEMAGAVDAMFTFSTADWMLTDRHRGKWPYKTLDDLKQKIDSDLFLTRKDSAHIILLHDQDDIHNISLALTRHFVDKGFSFAQV